MGGKASDPNKAAMKAQREQMARLDAISTPELEEYILQNPELVGLLDVEETGKSQLKDIQLDPRLRAQQLQGLASLQEESEEGMSAADRMQMEELMDQVGAQGQSQRAAIQAQMERQGLSGSGAALASQLQGAQGSSNALRKQAMQMLAQSGDRRRQARREATGLAGQMEGQDFSRQAQVGSAQDAINRANAMNRQQVNQINLAARQGISNQRTNTANMQSAMANQLAQQNFNNQIAKAGGQGNVANAMSNIAANSPAKPSAFQAALGGAAQGAAIGSAVPGIGTGIGAAVGGLGGLFGAEDGGLAYENGGVVEGGVPVDRKALEAHQKQEAKFKRDYMRKIHSEILGNDNPNGKYIKAEDGVVVPSLEELRSAQGEYDKKLREDKLYGAGVVDSGKVKLDEGQTLGDLRDQKADAEMSGKLTKGLGALNKLLGAEPQQRRALNLGSFQMDAPENIMQTPQMVAMDNPFAQKAEDGAVIDPVVGILAKARARQEMESGTNMEASEPMMEQVMTESEKGSMGASDFASPEDRQAAMFTALKQQMDAMNPKQIPAMEDGGTYQAQDGSLMFTSDGMGDIVAGDSFERDRVDAKLNSGEMVLNAAQQQRLMDLIRGEISPDEMPEEDIVEGVPRDYQEDLMYGDDDDSQEVEAKGFKNLLKMLGNK